MEKFTSANTGQTCFMHPCAPPAPLATFLGLDNQLQKELEANTPNISPQLHLILR